MSLNVITKSITLPNGKTITLETGKLAKQADGSVVLKCGNTMLLATVCSKTEAGEEVFLLMCQDLSRGNSAAKPLTSTYNSKFRQSNRIKSGNVNRLTLRLFLSSSLESVGIFVESTSGFTLRRDY